MTTTAALTPQAMLAELERRLTAGARRRAIGTQITYIDTCKRFLDHTGHRVPTAKDVDAYIVWRREQGINENTLITEMARIKKLFDVNRMEWTFLADDIPAKVTSFAPALAMSQVEKIIMAQALFTPQERFYLAVSTSFASRREELCRIKKKDIDEKTITLHIAKQKKEKVIRHLIPEVLLPIIKVENYREYGLQNMSAIFHRICDKSGVMVGSGWGWHSIRRPLDRWFEQYQGGVLWQVWTGYVGWSNISRGMRFAGSAMAGRYLGENSTPENNPYALDKMIHPVLPTLKMWEKALGNSQQPLPKSNQGAK